MRDAATLFPRLFACLFATAVSAIGCNSSLVATYPVSGVVIFDDGAPVPFGVVEVRDDRGGHIARGKLDSSGQFKLGTFANDDGAVAGRHRAIVVQHFAPISGETSPGSSEHATHRTALIAPEFGSYETSGLVVDVHQDSANTAKLIVRRYSPD